MPNKHRPGKQYLRVTLRLYRNEDDIAIKVLGALANSGKKAQMAALAIEEGLARGVEQMAQDNTERLGVPQRNSQLQVHPPIHLRLRKNHWPRLVSAWESVQCGMREEIFRAALRTGLKAILSHGAGDHYDALVRGWMAKAAQAGNLIDRDELAKEAARSQPAGPAARTVPDNEIEQEGKTELSKMKNGMAKSLGA
jgi:hypothetical protein